VLEVSSAKKDREILEPDTLERKLSVKNENGIAMRLRNKQETKEKLMLLL